MEEESINNLMNKPVEEIVKEAQAGTGTKDSSTESIYGEEPIYTNIQYDRDAVKSVTKSFTAYGQADIPEDIKTRIMTIVPLLMKHKYIMRMGGDNQNKLEEAIAPLHMYKEIYLPWANANKQLTPSATRRKPSEYAYRVAVNNFLLMRREATEAKFNDLPFGVKSSLAKDSHILYGEKMDDKLGMIIIYTPCGITSFGRDVDFKALGRASNWIQYAHKFGVKIYNLGDETSYNELKMLLASEIDIQ